MISKLQTMLTPEPEMDENATASLAGFELQNRVYLWLQSDSWDVAWEGVKSRFTFRTSKDGERRLIQIAETRVLTEDNIYNTLGALTAFHQDHPNEQNARALVILPQIENLGGVDVAAAKTRGVDIDRETEAGFGPVAQ